MSESRMSERSETESERDLDGIDVVRSRHHIGKPHNTIPNHTIPFLKIPYDIYEIIISHFESLSVTKRN